jgi:hypothetical protein
MRSGRPVGSPKRGFRYENTSLCQYSKRLCRSSYAQKADVFRRMRAEGIRIAAELHGRASVRIVLEELLSKERETRFAIATPTVSKFVRYG